MLCLSTAPPFTASPHPQYRRPFSSPEKDFSWLYMTTFTTGFRIPPLFRQSRDRQYWEGRLYQNTMNIEQSGLVSINPPFFSKTMGALDQSMQKEIEHERKTLAAQIKEASDNTAQVKN